MELVRGADGGFEICGNKRYCRQQPHHVKEDLVYWDHKIDMEETRIHIYRHREYIEIIGTG